MAVVDSQKNWEGNYRDYRCTRYPNRGTAPALSISPKEGTFVQLMNLRWHLHPKFPEFIVMFTPGLVHPVGLDRCTLTHPIFFILEYFHCPKSSYVLALLLPNSSPQEPLIFLLFPLFGLRLILKSLLLGWYKIFSYIFYFYLNYLVKVNYI